MKFNNTNRNKEYSFDNDRDFVESYLPNLVLNPLTFLYVCSCCIETEQPKENAYDSKLDTGVVKKKIQI